MAYYVCSGAKLKCDCGSQQSDLGVIHPIKPALVEGKPIAAMLDHKPFVNIKPFGQCKSLANPVVAAATAANNGRLQKMPCVPNTVSPWMGCKMTVFVKGQPALLDNSKLMCMWCGMIEITNPGQNVVKEGAKSASAASGKIADEAKAKSVEVVSQDAENEEQKETKEVKELTVKDFAEILTKIESERGGKEGYEAARHYASNHIDYWKINKLAMKYVGKDGKEQNAGEEDNDPNLMPSRFMILYGADDKKLEANGNLDDYRDGFEGEEDHKMSVAKIRKALIELGCENIKDGGVFDYDVYFDFLDKYLRRFSRVDMDAYFNEDVEAGKVPTEDFAQEHGVFTWKYFEDGEHKRDHDAIIEKLNPKLGDELLIEKGGDPMFYMPGICYRYPWTPFKARKKIIQKHKINYNESVNTLGKGYSS